MINTSSNYQYKRKEVTPLLPKQYSKVLETGCGEGDFHEHLHFCLWPGSKVFAVWYLH
jgi:ubiquinone/menaquinone biosynthesis C-methylase UbiE